MRLTQSHSNKRAELSPIFSTLDFGLGIFTGVLAYYLYEGHPRSAISEEDRLMPLVRWKLAEWKHNRDQRLASSADENIDWKALVAEEDRK